MSARLILLGPPGAGKGTQAEKIGVRLAIRAISTGDIFRANVAGRTERGQPVQRYLHAGEYVPDDVTNAMVADRLAQDDARPGFLLDGYPRTEPQVAELDRMLAGAGVSLDAVVELTADNDEVVARLLGRAQEQWRADDTKSSSRRRLEVYAEQTEPLVRIYRDRGLLVEVDGLGEIEEVTDRLLRALEAKLER